MIDLFLPKELLDMTDYDGAFVLKFLLKNCERNGQIVTSHTHIYQSTPLSAFKSKVAFYELVKRRLVSIIRDKPGHLHAEVTQQVLDIYRKHTQKN